MVLLSKRNGRVRSLMRKLGFIFTLTLGFVALLFSRGVSKQAGLFQELSQGTSDDGIAHADAPRIITGSGGDSGFSGWSGGGGGGDSGSGDCGGCGGSGCGGGGGDSGSGCGGDSGGGSGG